MVPRNRDQEEHRQPHREPADDRRFRSTTSASAGSVSPASASSSPSATASPLPCRSSRRSIIYSATNANANFFIGNAGTGGGLYSLLANYSNNVAPDLVLKGTYDAKYGHFEVGALGRWFRDRYYPNQTLVVPSAAGGQNNTKMGGGGFVNIRMPATKYLDVGVHGLGGTGVGRYGTSTLPDITVHPDGTLEPIKAYQGLVSLEGHPTPKLDIFAYYGAEYAQRTVYLSTLNTSDGKLVGYAPITAVNTGCGIETLPTSTGNGFAGAAPYNPGVPANCAGVNPCRHRRHPRLHLPRLQQPQVRPSAVPGRLQLPHPRRMGWCRRRSQGDQQHGLHRNALLHPLNRCLVSKRAPFGVPFLMQNK